MTDPIGDDEISAYLDGELPARRSAEVAHALARDPALAARYADFAADKAALAACFRDALDEPLPPAWTARITTAASPRRRRRVVLPLALAASLVAAVGLGRGWLSLHGGDDRLLAEAEQARRDQIVVATRLAGPSLQDVASRDTVLARAVGLRVRAPDLTRLGWTLAEIDAYAHAAALRYRMADGRALTLFVHRSDGMPRFDILKTGPVRVCIWQDEVVGAVMMGEMSAGQMMRVASAAYVALNL
jgi:anti-sigma factor RsiW